MKSNISKFDRVVRILIPVLVAILYFSGVISGTLATVLIVASVILLVTGMINFCPLYFIFGISSRKKEG